MYLTHTPVLLDEVLQYLDPQSNQNFIDCTLGLGGHAQAMLEKTAPKGRLLAIEQNIEGLNAAKKNLQKFTKRLIFINDNFNNLVQIIGNANFQRVSGIFLDLGLASWQIENAGLGISFQKNEALNMRLANPKSETLNSKQIQNPKFKFPNITAADIINKYSVKELADLFYRYGDIRKSWLFAKRIEEARKVKAIKTTFDLTRALRTTNPKVLAPIFQALRIEVNEELKNLQTVLAQTLEVLEPGGRLAVISYHSGEDRLVKNFFRSNKNKFKILTKKPIIPLDKEIQQNSRARSAKMRVGEKCS